MSSVKPIEPSNPEQPFSGLSNFNDDSETEQPITRPKIRQQALFLSDSEEEDEQTITNKSSRYIKPNQTTTSNVDSNLDPEVEALFAGVEDDDDLFNFAPAAEPLDSAALDKEALERHKRSANADDLIPNIESSTPSMTPSGQQAKEDTATGKGKEKDRQANEKRVAARLDEAMLLGPSGFTKLVSLTQDFKVKGKGYEEKDLNRLLNIYHFWTQEMYPKTNFQDTVFRIERLCHSKRMNVALSVWRDEALGLSTGGKDSDDSDSEDESATAGRIKDTGFSTEAENVPSSRPASVPPSDVEDIDDFDIDAVLEAEERARIAAQSNLANVSSSASAAGDKRIENSNMDVDGDDDDEIWKIIDSTQQAPTAKNQPYAPSGRPSGVGGHDIDDEEMWDLASEMNLDPLKPDKSARVPLAEDTGEDMYV